MKFAYEDLSPTQFETLIVFLCQRLLGIAVQGFSTGPDGGRDAKFVGTAELHPSTASRWTGTTIIQAKHTNGLGKRFSDSDFFVDGSEKTVVGKEIPRIKSLRGRGDLDNYMLFSNRRLAGEAESTIRKYISQQCGVPEGSLYLCGTEQLEMWLKRFSDPDSAGESSCPARTLRREEPDQPDGCRLRERAAQAVSQGHGSHPGIPSRPRER